MYHRSSSPSPPPTFTHTNATPDLRVETTLHFQWQPRQRGKQTLLGRLAGWQGMCTSPSYTIVPNKHHVSNPAPANRPPGSTPYRHLQPPFRQPHPTVLHLRSTVAQPSSILASSRFYVRVTGRVGRLWDDLPTLPGWADREEKIRKKRKKHRHRQRHWRPKEKRGDGGERMREK